jgi:hypothetical protein
MRRQPKAAPNIAVRASSQAAVDRRAGPFSVSAQIHPHSEHKTVIRRSSVTPYPTRQRKRCRIIEEIYGE